MSPKRSVSSIFDDAGLSGDVCLHTLRHSFAARVVGAGHGLHATGKLLGHTQAATTHRSPIWSTMPSDGRCAM